MVVHGDDFIVAGDGYDLVGAESQIGTSRGTGRRIAQYTTGLRGTGIRWATSLSQRVSKTGICGLGPA